MGESCFNPAVRLAVFLTCLASPCLSADWDKKLTAGYLDSRQTEWFAWKTAKAPGGVCFSCHTGFTYLLARPSLRRALGETGLTPHEIGYVDGLKARLAAKDAAGIYPAFAKEPVSSQTAGVESIMAALFLAQDGGAMSADAKQAFDRMWSLQVKDGKAQGAWEWFSLNLDPWETPDSRYYGASVAALAVGSAPASYRKQADVKPKVEALLSYLERERDKQPLHHRLMALWASIKLPEAMPKAARTALTEEIWSKQQADGGWTITSLGPWKESPNAPPSVGSNSYATSFTAAALLKSGVKGSDPRMKKALDWLLANQDKQSGAWKAPSMNKVFEPGSMQVRFMDDSATAFAAMALLEGAK